MVTEVFAYDLGRRTATMTNNIATVGSVTTSTVYDRANHKTITYSGDLAATT